MYVILFISLLLFFIENIYSFDYFNGQSIEDQSNLEAGDWLDAFVRAINTVDYSTRGTKFSDTLFAAKAAFCDAYADDEDVNVIDALGQAVCAAQKQTSHVMPDSGRIPNNIDENVIIMVNIFFLVD